MNTFTDSQYALAEHVRNPEKKASMLDGIEPRRLSIYQELIFNNLFTFTSSALPVAYSIMGEDWWRNTVRQFLIEHHCSSPYFNEIAGEFISYLREHPHILDDAPAFLLELMHYEWVELALDNVKTDTEQLRQQLSDNLMDKRPVVSPAAWLLSYEYPVHEISVDNQPSPEQKKNTLLLVFRKPDLNIGFRLLAPVFALLWQQLLDSTKPTGEETAQRVAQQLNVAYDDNFRQNAAQALHELYTWGAMLGAE